MAAVFAKLRNVLRGPLIMPGELPMRRCGASGTGASITVRWRSLAAPMSPTSSAACGLVASTIYRLRSTQRMGQAISNQLAPMPYLAWQSSMDAARPAGRLCAIRSFFLAELIDGFIEALIEQFAKSPSKHSVAIVEHCHGVIANAPPDATAFALRRNPYHFEIIAFWDDAAETTVNLAWADRFFAATFPFSTGEVYVNSLDEHEAHRIPNAYGVNYQRLKRIKQRYDPTNFFRFNQNILPSHE